MATGNVGGDGTLGPRTPPKTKAKVSPMRNVIAVVVLVLCVGAAVVELRANQGYNNAVDKLSLKNDAMPNQVEAEKIIGKRPDGPMIPDETGNEQKASYSWQGLRGKYVLKVLYTKDKIPVVVRLEPQ